LTTDGDRWEKGDVYLITRVNNYVLKLVLPPDTIPSWVHKDAEGRQWEWADYVAFSENQDEGSLPVQDFRFEQSSQYPSFDSAESDALPQRQAQRQKHARGADTRTQYDGQKIHMLKGGGLWPKGGVFAITRATASLLYFDVGPGKPLCSVHKDLECSHWELTDYEPRSGNNDGVLPAENMEQNVCLSRPNLSGKAKRAGRRNLGSEPEERNWPHLADGASAKIRMLTTGGDRWEKASQYPSFGNAEFDALPHREAKRPKNEAKAERTRRRNLGLEPEERNWPHLADGASAKIRMLTTDGDRWEKGDVYLITRVNNYVLKLVLPPDAIPSWVHKDAEGRQWEWEDYEVFSENYEEGSLPFEGVPPSESLGVWSLLL